ncbi:MAG: DNA-directed RNA polymerase subunit beta [Candidatus Puniceispirillum sp.]|nr:DNA-directed RNA polymerase subunit beta [Candidatus Pelagibacter sp.]MBA4283567.1 DNA-directed RNA polymerase subunit beta [Candidatus Puniceispirillum sp.]
MGRSYTGRKRFRRNFGRNKEVAELPNLIALQKYSYDRFLQAKVPYDQRENVGLQEVFKSIFPIKDSSGKSQLEFHSYELEQPKYDETECRQRGLTYSAPLRLTFRLVVWDVDVETGARSIRDIKEQDVYTGDIPLMTDSGTFIVNGIERVIVSQMHRSPGVFFDHDKGKTHSSGKILYAGRVVPYRGSWIDFEFDPKDTLYVRIDRRKKLLLTTFLMALEGQHPGLGMTREEILKYFYSTVTYKKTKKGWVTAYEENKWKGVKLSYDLINAETGEVVAENGTKISPRLAKKFTADGLKEIIVSEEILMGQYVADEFVNEKTGEIFIESGDEITEELLEKFESLGESSINILFIDYINVGSYLHSTLMGDKNFSRDDALMDLYRCMRPGEPPTVEGGEAIFNSLFFDAERYDLSAVGRVKLNARLGLDEPDTTRVLTKTDILSIVKVLLELKDGRGEIDDIDNLGNRRVRSVGELVENQFRIGIVRMERTIRERMGSVDIDTVMPNDLVNAKPIVASMREFFGSSQLSQFMDQTNPLSEITHKRRLSALGPGGLSRDRAGFEVRDVHPTHYGRICPIETPEGPNIGLINSLSTFARINKYGFIETPYRAVNNCKVTDEVIYMTAMQEAKYNIAPASAEIDSNGEIVGEFITGHKGGELCTVHRNDIQMMDVSPKQLVSVAASLIPFLENDDASRALMGSNMQRQAVPLLKSQAPFVGTGMEATVAKDSGAVIVAKRSGVIDQVDGKRIVVQSDTAESLGDVGVDIYTLTKFQGSNMSTCISQKPLVRKGDFVQQGDIIADGPSTDLGELALGRNVTVAFMSWQGNNFEDSIVVSSNISKDDVFTSVHIDGFDVMARDTKLGNEDLTRDIPNVGEEALRNLDESGIIYVGSEVRPGDILVGKVTPKGESPMTPEEKLLRAIFGEKAADVRDSSLRVPPGVYGTIVEVRVFSRRGVEKDERSVAIERQQIEQFAKNRDDERAIIERSYYQQLATKLMNQKVVSGPAGVKQGAVIDQTILSDHPQSQWRRFVVEDSNVNSELEAMKAFIDDKIAKLQAIFENRVEKLRKGDELPPGVLKMVKVFIAVKRKLQPGDKMAGRHGNKGVVSKVVPLEDMPYLEDGTPVDIILNPLGLPSRMNVGQILETHLGAAAKGLGQQIERSLNEYKRGEVEIKAIREKLMDIYESDEDQKDIKKMKEEELLELANNLKHGVPMATPVFDGVPQATIEKLLVKAGLDTSGQVTLYDGRTGEAFDRKVTVGQIYMLKLHHLVDDKIHARSIGPYSLVTQQPLGGKAQFGGQRLGEMEVWALEAYGAAHTLQEMLTVKSDDVSGRMKVYEAIVRGDENMEAGIPESFNVLVKELRSLGLNLSFDYE